VQQAFLNHWVEWAVIFAFLIPAAFPLVASRFWPWWEDDLGVNLVMMDVAVAIAAFPAFLHYVVGAPLDLVEYQYLRNIALSAVPVIVIWRTIIIYRTQREGVREKARHRRREAEKDDSTAT
jgi:hypothetical protein